jgi:hypothetical protein
VTAASSPRPRRFPFWSRSSPSLPVLRRPAASQNRVPARRPKPARSRRESRSSPQRGPLAPSSPARRPKPARPLLSRSIETWPKDRVPASIPGIDPCWPALSKSRESIPAGPPRLPASSASCPLVARSVRGLVARACGS